MPYRTSLHSASQGTAFGEAGEARPNGAGDPAGAPGIRVLALGSLVVENARGVVTGAAAQPRRSAILLLLLRAGARGLTREKIISLLWPDAPDERVRRTLAQALYSLRRDLGAPEAILGTSTLRLNRELVSSDVADFERAVARGDLEEAVRLYRGGFADGFALPEAPEFERWLEEERRALVRAGLAALKRRAAAATRDGPAAQAVAAWRGAVAFDPVDTGATVGLMKALIAAGDLAGAHRAGQDHSHLLAAEYDLPPAPDVQALLEELGRPTQHPVRPISPRPAPLPEPAERAIEPVPQPSERSWRSWAPRRWRWWAVAACAVVVAAWSAVIRLRRPLTAQVVVVGQIANYAADTTGIPGGAARELLATDLARATGLAVLSSARLYDVLHALGRLEDTSRTGYLIAARAVGAAHLFDGSIWPLPDGGYRVDLRRVDPASGVITAERTVTGTDLYAIVDSLALWVASGLGAEAGEFLPVTTSLEAFRWYQEGVRAMARDDRVSAYAHLSRALEHDSLLVMAEYYRALVAPYDPLAQKRWLDRANALSGRLGLRDRLVVRSRWMLRDRPETAGPVIDSLARLFPAEVEGHLVQGQYHLARGEFRAALPPLERALAMVLVGDSSRGGSRYLADIETAIITAFVESDSLPRALEEARRFYARVPNSYRARTLLAWAFRLNGFTKEALEGYREAHATANLDVKVGDRLDGHLLDALGAEGEYEEADRYLADYMARTGPDAGGGYALGDARFWHVLMLRDRGEFTAAARALALQRRGPDAGLTEALAQARLFLLTGETARARGLFDSIASATPAWHGTVSSSAARRSHLLTLMYLAEAVALDGDLSALQVIRDSMARMVPAGAAPQQVAPLRHVEGLLYQLQGRLPESERAFRAAQVAPVLGYTWTGLDLARVLMEEGRPRAAIAPLQAALRHQVFATGIADAFVPRGVVQAHLVRAWELAGEADSARLARERLTHLMRRADRRPRVFPDPARPNRPRNTLLADQGGG